jgi:2,5-diamino-6-(ribosylamino)-4(3H)-pyrimidinone 5'-phosphate reductase
MLPRLIVHNAVSLDSRIEGFPADVGLYYELAERWKVDAHLAGCDTMLQMESEIPDVDDCVIQPPSPVDSNDSRPLLVVPDSRGRLRRWRGIRQMPYWRGAVALCSRSTPQDLGGPKGPIPLHLTHLERMRDDIVWLRYEVVRELGH